MALKSGIAYRLCGLAEGWKHLCLVLYLSLRSIVFEFCLSGGKAKIQKFSPSKRAQDRLQWFAHQHEIKTKQRPPFRVYYIGDVAGNGIKPNEASKSVKHIESNYKEQIFTLFQTRFCGLNRAETPKSSWLQHVQN